MAWLKKIPRLSLPLLLLTYGVEGWMYGSWVTKFLERGVILTQLNEQTGFGIFYGIAVASILLFLVVFTAPVSLMTISWLKSDTVAFISIFLGAFGFALIVQRVDYFARFLVLAASASLVKLDLQLVGCNRWFCFFTLTIFCWLGFTVGILAFYTWGF